MNLGGVKALIGIITLVFCNEKAIGCITHILIVSVCAYICHYQLQSLKRL